MDANMDHAEQSAIREKMEMIRERSREMGGMISQRMTEVNVGEMERWASLAGGVALAALGIKRGGMTGMALGLLATSLVHRGASGHCELYRALGVNTAHEGPHTAGASVNGQEGIKVEKTITINADRSELFQFWRKLDNLPQIMSHLEAVTILSDTRSHWVAKGPVGSSVEWDAEIINERENELIAWRSMEDADVDNAGSVRFEEGAGGTVVKVALIYKPPAGKLGGMVARIMGEEPSIQIEEDLGKFKNLVESGAVAGVQRSSTGTGGAIG